MVSNRLYASGKSDASDIPPSGFSPAMHHGSQPISPSGMQTTGSLPTTPVSNQPGSFPGFGLPNQQKTVGHQSPAIPNADIFGPNIAQLRAEMQNPGMRQMRAGMENAGMQRSVSEMSGTEMPNPRIGAPGTVPMTVPNPMQGSMPSMGLQQQQPPHHQHPPPGLLFMRKKIISLNLA